MSSISILTGIRQVLQAADAAFAEKCDTLTLRQFMLLDAVAKSEGCTQMHIVEATGIDRSTASDMIRRLGRDGMLSQIVADDDKRANRIFLTAEGQAALRGARGAARSVANAAARSLATLTETRSAA